MLATLCWYENWLGPYHPRTLSLMAQVGDVSRKRKNLRLPARCWSASSRDGDRHLGRAHELRLEAMTALRDLLLAMNEFESAVRIQGEILECQAERFGADHPRAPGCTRKLSDAVCATQIAAWRGPCSSTDAASEIAPIAASALRVRTTRKGEFL